MVTAARPCICECTLYKLQTFLLRLLVAVFSFCRQMQVMAIYCQITVYSPCIIAFPSPIIIFYTTPKNKYHGQMSSYT